MRNEPSLYDCLKVTPDAPFDVIRAAYRALAAMHHPDRVGASKASHDEMAAINSAYALLMDPERRADYDAQLINGYRGMNNYAARARYAAATEVADDSVLTDEPLQPPPRPRRYTVRQETDARPNFGDTRIDVGWMSPPAPQQPRRTRRNEFRVLGVVLAAGLIAGFWVSHQQIERAQAELALTAHLHSVPPEPDPNAAQASRQGSQTLMSVMNASAPETAAAPSSADSDAARVQDALLTAPSSAGPVLMLQVALPGSAASAASAASADPAASSGSGMVAATEAASTTAIASDVGASAPSSSPVVRAQGAPKQVVMDDGHSGKAHQP